MTSVTTLLALISLYVLGGDVIRGFRLCDDLGCYCRDLLVGLRRLHHSAETGGEARLVASRPTPPATSSATSMPEAFQAALQTPGLFWLLITIGAAGLVRGFTGFGTAMIFVPVGAQFLPSADVVFLMVLMGVFSTITLFPQAWSKADRAEVGALSMAAAVTVPAGLWLMSQMDPLTLRWVAAGVIGVTLGRGGLRLALAGQTRLAGAVRHRRSRWHRGRHDRPHRAGDYRLLPRQRARCGTGPGQHHRVPGSAGRGDCGQPDLWRAWPACKAVILACLLGIPYMITTLTGKALFDPKLEKIYRFASYSVIALAVLSSLPVFD